MHTNLCIVKLQLGNYSWTAGVRRRTKCLAEENGIRLKH